MSTYSNRITSSDLDAYKYDGNTGSSSITVSGTLGVGEEKLFYTNWISISGLDYIQANFNNNKHEATIWWDIISRWATPITETTRSSNLTGILVVEIEADRLRFGFRLVNPYDEAITLETTVISFEFVGYTKTL